MTIDAAGTTVADDVVTLSASDTVLITTADTLTVKREGADPVMVVNSIETKLRDSSIGLVGEDVLYMQGGTLGVMMNDAVVSFA